MKSIFITGAAAGIGLATARHFSHKGWSVGLYDINQEGLANVIASGELTNAHSGYCDVTSRQSIDRALADFASKNEGRIDVIVNNAGVLSAGPLTETTPASVDLMLDINIKGLTHVAQLGFAYLSRTPGSCLVNLCSASSIHGIPNLAVYSASKFYVDGLTQALHLEWAQHDIRVTCVKPHLVDTPMAHDVVARASDGAQQVKLTPEDIAQAIDKAVHGKRLSYIVGEQAKLWALATKLLPEGLAAKLTQRILTSD